MPLEMRMTLRSGDSMAEVHRQYCEDHKQHFAKSPRSFTELQEVLKTCRVFTTEAEAVSVSVEWCLGITDDHDARVCSRTIERLQDEK